MAMTSQPQYNGGAADPSYAFPKKNDSLIRNSGLTKLEYACIHTGIPETGNAHLDAIIEASIKKNIYTSVLNSCLQSGDSVINAIAKAQETVDTLKKVSDMYNALTDAT